MVFNPISSRREYPFSKFSFIKLFNSEYCPVLEVVCLCVSLMSSKVHQIFCFLSNADYLIFAFFFFFFTDQSLPMKTLGSFSWPQGLHPLLHHPQNPVTMSRSYGTHPSASHVSLALCYPFTELECLRGQRAAVMKPVPGIFSPVSGFVPWLCGGVTAGTHR